MREKVARFEMKLSYDEEEKLKRILDIPQNERIAIFLGAGYYKEETKITCSPRKKIKDIYKKI